MTNKPFMSVDAQIQLLNSRGMTTDDNTRSLLLRHGYYAIVNGYKDPFLDKQKTNSIKEDRYKPGTTFNMLYELYKFDVVLRNETFKYIAEVESILKTAISYVFSKNHSEDWAYLKSENFSAHDKENTEKLISTLNDRANVSTYVGDDVKHYRENHSCVPLWVLTNSLTLGNIWHFYKLLNPKDKNEVCKLIAKNAGSKKYLDPKEAQDAIEIILKFRNACAHNERLYCKRIGRKHSTGYSRLVISTSKFLPEVEFIKFMTWVINKVLEYRSIDASTTIYIADKIEADQLFDAVGLDG